jgi:hypothetical protein
LPFPYRDRQLVTLELTGRARAMRHQEDASCTPPNDRYFSTWGPTATAILLCDEPSALGVVTSPDEPMPVGMAFPTRRVEAVNVLKARRGVGAVKAVEWAAGAVSVVADSRRASLNDDGP